MSEQPQGQERSRDSAPETSQPDPEASSDGDRSWTADPASDVDPDEDRSVETVVERETRRSMRPVRRSV